MSFHVTIKRGKLDASHQNQKQKVSVVITSTQERIVGSFSHASAQTLWDDSFIARSSQRELQFMLVKEKQKGKSAIRLSSNFINLSKFLYQQKPQTRIFLSQSDQILLSSSKAIDSITIQVLYVSTMNFIGPIQFYRKAGSKDFQEEQQQNIIEIEGDNKNLPFWKNWLQKVKSKKEKLTQILQQPQQMENVKFYKGAHKNRNIFSFCDQVYDDQKFTVIENYYNDQ